MKRVLFLAMMMMATLGFAQEKDTIKKEERILTLIDKVDLYDGITENSNGNCYGKNMQFPKYRKEKSEALYINNIIKCKNDTFISGYSFGKQYFIRYDGKRAFSVDGKVTTDIETAIQKIKTFADEEYINFVNTAKKASIISLLGEYYTLSDELDKYDKYGIGVIYARPKIDYSISGAEFKIYNASKKTIKYITFNFHAKNAVGDKVLYRKGAYSTSRKGIGPVEPYSTGAWEFDTVWLTDIVDELITTTIVIQYMDGTIKTIKMNDNMWMDNDLISNVNKLSDMMDENENIK